SDERHHDRRADRDQDRDRQSEGYVGSGRLAPLRNETLWEEVAVQVPDGREHRAAQDRAERDLGPHRSQAEPVPYALPSPHREHRHDRDAGEHPDDPAPGPADRPFGASAEAP